MNEEDAARPANYWETKPLQDKMAKKFTKKVPKGGDVAAMQRAASIRWYKEIEMKKGAGVSDAGFQEWFHGVITRKEAEVTYICAVHVLCADALDRLFCARRSLAPSLSVSAKAASVIPSPTCMHVGLLSCSTLTCLCSVGVGKIKHYMVEQTAATEYQVVGNPKQFSMCSRLSRCHSRADLCQIRSTRSFNIIPSTASSAQTTSHCCSRVARRMYVVPILRSCV